ncbi:MAG: type II toxin-antitoxin system HicB family antitoxin [Spirochaetia bacterium]|jgi:predicted RNase H-like HicB family nuclease|nr:type II toxin-antitoxin system HicB family antitoxin [Spirochaetia bacterium]
MKYHFKVQAEDKGFSAICMELPECLSEGNTMDELRANLKEALDLTLDEPAGSNYTFPLPDPTLEGADEVISISVDPQLAFALFVRQYRVSRRWTLRQAQQALGLPNRTSYTRLEQKGNPRLSTLEKIWEAYEDFPMHRVSKKAV